MMMTISSQWYQCNFPDWKYWFARNLTLYNDFTKYSILRRCTLYTPATLQRCSMHGQVCCNCYQRAPLTAMVFSLAFVDVLTNWGNNGYYVHHRYVHFATKWKLHISISGYHFNDAIWCISGYNDGHDFSELIMNIKLVCFMYIPKQWQHQLSIMVSMHAWNMILLLQGISLGTPLFTLEFIAQGCRSINYCHWSNELMAREICLLKS